MALGLPARAELPAAPPDCEHHLLSLDADGTVVAGSMAALESALQDGRAVHIGFRLADDGEYAAGDGWYLTHWIAAHEMSLMGGHVFTKALRVHRHLPNGELDADDLTGASDLIVSLIGSDGTLVARHEGEKLPRPRRMDSWWCAVAE